MSLALDRALALHRFGVGARPQDMDAGGDPRQALKAQLKKPDSALVIDDALPASWEAARALARAAAQKKIKTPETSSPNGAMEPPASMTRPADPGPPGLHLKEAMASDDPGFIRRAVYQGEILARLKHGATTPAGFLERLVLFWTNHFAVSADKGNVHVLAGAMEREAIRPNVLGRFRDLLGAAERHPAMLLFLDNLQSIGPNSRAGLRRKKGLNENLAREMLELHTIGVDGGYTQADVTNLAKILTGWSWAPPNKPDAEAAKFAFFPERHEPGPQTLLGRVYAQSGRDQGEAVLDDLARHPATARHIARKLAAHFIADVPPPAAVQRIERAFLESDGSLAHVAGAIVDCPEAWDLPLRKIKTPYEFILGVARLKPEILDQIPLVMRGFNAMGQRPFAPPSPKGFEDTKEAWLSPHAFKERVDWSSLVATRLPTARNPADMARDIFGDLLSQDTSREIAQASSGAQGVTLLLMSPEFQRR